MFGKFPFETTDSAWATCWSFLTNSISKSDDKCLTIWLISSGWLFKKNKRRPSLTHTQVLHLIIQSFTALIEENGRGQASGMRPVTKTSGSLVDTKINNCFFFLKKKKTTRTRFNFLQHFLSENIFINKKKKRRRCWSLGGSPQGNFWGQNGRAEGEKKIQNILPLVKCDSRSLAY